MSTTCAALLRGINVGRAKRVPMAELRVLVSSLGFGDVRTLLNSGNVVFTAPQVRARASACVLEKALMEKFGFEVRTVVVTAREMGDVVTQNPFARTADDHSRMLVAFVDDAAALSRLAPLEKEDTGTSRLACGDRAAYIWCPDGILESPIPDAVGKLLKDRVITTRNWATTLKLHSLMQPA